MNEETIKLWGHMMISPTCSICETPYHTKAYGGNLEYCPSCQVHGANYLRELEIEKLAHEARVGNILMRWKRKLALPEEELV
jgi:uncharacterized Zn finger protein (UPF0148 family)